VCAALILAGILLPCGLFSGATQNGKVYSILPADKIRTVVIDPGHGGKDPGCNGSFVNEKNVALAISLKLGRLIEDHFPEVRVVYTRKTDIFLELYQRAQIANEADADLFICIHCNSGAPEAHGSETYALGLHKSEANLAVAKRENESILLENDYSKNYEGFDVNSPEGSIIFSLYQNTFLNRSLSFAAKCQKYFSQDAGRHNRGVKQAGFLVLVKTAMPAVLIESGFLTNHKEEKFLMNSENQMIMATSIFRAFTDYKNEIEGTHVVPDIIINRWNPEEYQTVKPTQDIIDSTKNRRKDTLSVKEPEVYFAVQFLSSPSFISLDHPDFKKLIDVRYTTFSGIYRYTTGIVTNFEMAKKLQSKVRSTGYPDAFLVAFRNNSRITVKEALDILGGNQ
jgi:N-acetylmuramoyl-L-alanine amidase